MSIDRWATPDVPLDKPSVARMYDYYLGGFHNFAIDRQSHVLYLPSYKD